MAENNQQSQIKKWVKDNEETLLAQSRSFAIPILNLNNRFKIPVMVEYNLNKTIDTIEDSAALTVAEKIELIGMFCDRLEKNEFSPEVQKRMIEVTPEEESSVFKNYESTINLFNSLTEREKKLGKKWTIEMAQGMCKFLEKSIKSINDLNEYCYFVAGTVGLYLTDLLRTKGKNLSDAAFEKMQRNAVHFGLFLQKLNIIRDYEEDKIIKKRSFWPEDYFLHEKDPLKILNKMCYETLKNDASRAIRYYTQIPPGNEMYDFFIRFILSSGMEYIKLLKNNLFVFAKEKVKLQKSFIQNLYDRVASLDRDDFRAYCEQLHSEEMAFYKVSMD